MFHKMKGMRTKQFITVAAALIIACAAVTAQTKQWSLTDCIGYALEQNIQVRKAGVSVSLGELNLQQAKDNMLPSLSGSMGENLGWRLDAGGTDESSWVG